VPVRNVWGGEGGENLRFRLENNYKKGIKKRKRAKTGVWDWGEKLKI